MDPLVRPCLFHLSLLYLLLTHCFSPSSSPPPFPSPLVPSCSFPCPVPLPASPPLLHPRRCIPTRFPSTCLPAHALPTLFRLFCRTPLLPTDLTSILPSPNLLSPLPSLTPPFPLPSICWHTRLHVSPSPSRASSIPSTFTITPISPMPQIITVTMTPTIAHKSSPSPPLCTTRPSYSSSLSNIPSSDFSPAPASPSSSNRLVPLPRLGLPTAPVSPVTRFCFVAPPPPHHPPILTLPVAQTAPASPHSPPPFTGPPLPVPLLPPSAFPLLLV
ncbi:unnamed protein product [Closterium sp. Naga37s-1]|nr:unnamed protein product [Closterium sp. Naga37s-1]